MELKILGSVSPYPKCGCNCPGYIIKNNDKNILLDCGSGISRLMSFPSDLENLTIIISHLHKDHYSDLSSIAYASYVYHNLGLLENKIKVYIPYEEDLEDYNYLMNFGQEKYMDFYVYDESNKLKINDVDIEFYKTKHPIKTYAINLSNNGSKISYSADTGYDENLIKFFQDADILICETSFLKGQKKKKENNHLDVEEAVSLGTKSNAKKIILTHFWPEIDKEKYLLEAQEYSDKVETAQENKIYKLRHK